MPTEFYTQDEITWCVARARPIPKWRSIFSMGQGIEVHICTWSALVITIILTFFLSTFERRPFDAWKSMIYVFHLFLNGYVTTPKTRAMKFFVIYFMFILMISYTMINASLIKYMTGVAFDKQINTFDELKNQNFHFVSQSSAMKYLNRANLVRCLLKLTFKIVEFH